MLLTGRSPLLPVIGLALLASAVGCDRPSATAIDVSLVATPTKEASTAPLLVRAMTAKIDGVWHDLAKAQVKLDLPLGRAPEARHLMRIAPPSGQLTAIRLSVADARPGKKDHVIEAACNESIPSCGAGVMLLQLDQPAALTRGEGKPVLHLISLNAVSGICGDLVVVPNADMGMLPAPDLAPDPACNNVVCPPGFECQAGMCVVTDPCMNVVCPPGQMCSAGQCVTPSDMSQPTPDMSQPPAPDMSKPPAPDMSKPSCGGDHHDHDNCGHDHGCDRPHSCGHDHHCGGSQSCPK